jgi:hypothetical protein
MDIIKNPPYTELQHIYNEYFSLGYLNTDITSKFALISLTGYLVYRIKQKKPDITSYVILKKIIGDELPEDFIKGVAVVVDDFSYGCKEFPTFNIEDKKIPAKIKEILSSYVPF